MTRADSSDASGAASVGDLEALRRRASDLARQADAATQRYDRTVGIRYAAILFPVPFAVVLFRAHMQAPHYYVAGALFLAVMLVMYALDLEAVAKRDEAIQAAQCAHDAYEAAQESQRAGG